MKYAAMAIGLVFTLNLCAQQVNHPATGGLAILQGHVAQMTHTTFDVIVTSSFGYYQDVAAIEDNGNFVKQITVEKKVQDLYLLVNDEYIPFFAGKNDTITINWDAKDFDNTITLKNSNAERDHDLQAMMTLYKLYRKQDRDLIELVYKNGVSDSVKFIEINALYNKEIATVLADGTHPGTSKLVTDIYFHFAYLLLNTPPHPMVGYDLYIEHPSEVSRSFPILNQLKFYRNELKSAFDSSVNYRSFLFDYLRLNNADHFTKLGPENTKIKMPDDVSPVMKAYYSGLQNLNSAELKDWYATLLIMLQCQMSAFKDADAIYQDFKMKVKTPFYADSLERFFTGPRYRTLVNQAPKDWEDLVEHKKVLSTSTTRNGYTLIFVNDTALAPGVKERFIETFFTVYPKEAKTYNPKASKNVIFVVDADYDGIAVASKSVVRFNPAWFRQNPQDIDVVTHEVMHIVQGYPSGNNPGWLWEGIADYVRYKMGVDNAGGGWTMPDYSPGQSYTDAYRITARFLVWVEKKYNNDLVKQMDAAMRADTYSPELWKKITGKTLDELWKEYAGDPKI